VIVLAPTGRVIEYVAPGFPLTVNVAAVTVPVTAGRVTPPVAVRVAAGASITVPGLAFTATLPKFISLALVIEIGVTMVAVAVAVADTWAIALAVKATITIEIARIFFMILI
jgi:hypothetical protein